MTNLDELLRDVVVGLAFLGIGASLWIAIYDIKRSEWTWRNRAIARVGAAILIIGILSHPKLLDPFDLAAALAFLGLVLYLLGTISTLVDMRRDAERVGTPGEFGAAGAGRGGQGAEGGRGGEGGPGEPGGEGGAGGPGPHGEPGGKGGQGGRGGRQK